MQTIIQDMGFHLQALFPFCSMAATQYLSKMNPKAIHPGYPYAIIAMKEKMIIFTQQLITFLEMENAMFRLWAKIFKDNRMLKDIVICNDSTELNRTRKIFNAIDEICYQFDLAKPIWLDSTIEDFKKHDKTRFTQDNFIEHIDFDYLEIQVIEEG
jgi:hypothetical protein